MGRGRYSLGLMAAAGVLLACGRPQSTEQHGVVPFDQVFAASSWVPLRADTSDPIGRAASVIEWNGMVLIADALQANVKVFATDGQLVRTIGRAGDGPGEFRGPNALMALQNGRLGVYDWPRSTLSVFNKAGDFERRFSISGSVPGAIQVVGSSMFLMPGQLFGIVPERRLALHLVDSVGNVIRSFGELPALRYPGEGSFDAPCGALVGSTWVWAARTDNVVFFEDTSVDGTRFNHIGDAAYRPVDWEHGLQHTPVDPVQATRWFRKQMWLDGLIPLDSTRFLVEFTRWNDGPAEVEHWYSITDVNGHTLVTAGPTPVRLYSVVDGELLGLTSDSVGNARLGRFAIPVRP